MKRLIQGRLLPILLSLLLLVGLVQPAYAVSDNGLSFSQIDKLSQSLLYRGAAEEESTPDYAPDDRVRVSIVLKTPSVLAAEFSTLGISENAEATAYRDRLKEDQERAAAAIGHATGESFDVVWNLTLAANLISAEVSYGSIETISALEQVDKVVLEPVYEPAEAQADTAEPNMATSAGQTGSDLAWAVGYTGAGSRIAIIDTGLDTDHQSFDNGAFLYSLAALAKEKGMTTEDYLRSLHLLSVDEIAGKLDQLNIKGVDAETLRLNDKTPFAYNYVDGDYDVTHDNDRMGEHGSHVAGISAANRFVPDGKGGYTDALQTVKMQGVAPDAQLLVFKVFGKKGGAYASDYMAAIEDAIVLGCDSVNLSLGTRNPGFSDAGLYQSIMDMLTESDTVVTFSAGNSGAWADYAYNGGGLYADDVNFQTDGAPGSYRNGLTVASVDNRGLTTEVIRINGEDFLYFDGINGQNNPLQTLAGTQEYVLLDGVGTAEEFARIKGFLKGRIAVCSRGAISFGEKAAAAMDNGAIALIVCNNEPGILRMRMEGYTGTAPAASVIQRARQALKTNARLVTDKQGEPLCYLGTLEIPEGQWPVLTESYDKMSSFSAWGVPGSLLLKPEITAPGGNIYSVNGSVPGGKEYMTMSGTSMAAPQVAGLTALLMQYLRENGLAEAAGVSLRVLAQSLLMSTARPLFNYDGNCYYSVLQQGAGLARIDAALASGSYLLMDDNATESAADGKIKAELGDDPLRVGEYRFGFTVNGLNGSASYTLATSLFTQAIVESEGGLRLDATTAALAANVTYTVDGQELRPDSLYLCDLDGDGDTDADDAQIILEYAAGCRSAIDARADLNGDGKIDSYDAYLLLDGLKSGSFTVAAGQSAHVSVTICLSNASRELLDRNYRCGAYVEGFVSVDPVASQEGVQLPSHSIPVLGFYGNWSEPSMFERITYTDYLYGDTTLPYAGVLSTNVPVIRFPGSSDAFYSIGNPYGREEMYPAGREAISSKSTLYRYDATLIRNAGQVMFYAMNGDGELIELSRLSEQTIGAFFYTNGGTWQNRLTQWLINRRISTFGVSEGDRLTVSLIAIPEYYCKNGTLSNDEVRALIREDKLGDGAFLSTSYTIDDTAPEIVSISRELLSEGLRITARDNQYIASVVVLDKNGTKVLATAMPKQTQAGQAATAAIDLTGIAVGQTCIVLVADYAGNETYYTVEYGGESEDFSGGIFGFTQSNGLGGGKRWVRITPEELHYKSESDYSGVTLTARFNETITAAEYIKGVVFMLTQEGVLLAADQGDWGFADLVGMTDPSLGITDLAYSSSDGKLYGIGVGNKIYSIDLLTAQTALICTLTVTNPKTKAANNLRLRTLAIDDDGNFYSTNDTTASANSFLYRWTTEQMSAGTLTLAPAFSVATGGNGGLGGQSLAWDHDKDLLYWADGSATPGLRIFDLGTGKSAFAPSSYNSRQGGGRTGVILSGLYIVPSDKTRFEPSTEAVAISLNRTELTLLPGTIASLSATVLPWNLKDASVTWSSSDSSVVAVDAQGELSARSVGTAVITATTAAEPHLTASCTVTVRTLDAKAMRGLAYNEKQGASWIRFDPNEASNWVSEGKATGLNSGGVLFNGKLYGIDSDGLYETDPDTLETVRLGRLNTTWYWSDAAPAPRLYGDTNDSFGYIVGVCNGGQFLALIDPYRDDLLYWDLSTYFSVDPMAVIAYAGSDRYRSGRTASGTGANHVIDREHFYVMTEAGILYRITLSASFGDTSGYDFSIAKLGETGIDLSGVGTAGGPAFASLLAEERSGYLLLTVANSGDTTRLYAIDPETIISTELGNFGTDIQPVTNLYQFDRAEGFAVRIGSAPTDVYIGDSISLSARTVFADARLTWTTSDASVATVDESGVVTAHKAGSVTITASAESNGVRASADVSIQVLPLGTANANVHAQLVINGAAKWVRIDTASLLVTVEGNASTALTVGGVHNGKIYGSVTSYAEGELTNFIIVDPKNGYAEENGSLYDDAWIPVDMTTAPGITIDVDGEEENILSGPVVLSHWQRFGLITDALKGNLKGWMGAPSAGSNGAAIAYLGTGSYQGYDAMYYSVLCADGNLYDYVLYGYYDEDEEEVVERYAYRVRGNVGTDFKYFTGLTMTYSAEAGGLIVGYNNTKRGVAELYFIDLRAVSPVCVKLGVLDATYISTLYTDAELNGTLGAIELPEPVQSAPVHDEEAALPASVANRGDFVPQSIPSIRENDTLITVKVTAKDAQGTDVSAFNGVTTVQYDAEHYVLKSVVCHAAQYAVRQEEGTLTVAYAGTEALDRIMTLVFERKGEGALKITTKDVGSEHSGYTEVIGTACPSSHLPDVPAGAWYHEAVDYVLQAGLMQGDGQRFDPNGGATRAMLVQTLYNLAGASDKDTASGFADVPESQWYAAAITWARKNGIVTGDDSSHFAPGRLATRQETVTMLYRFVTVYLGWKASERNDLSEFTDKDSVAAYALDAMQWAVGVGLVNGMGDGTLAPTATATRAELAALLMRLHRILLNP